MKIDCSKEFNTKEIWEEDLGYEIIKLTSLYQLQRGLRDRNSMLRNELRIKSQALDKYYTLPVTTYTFIFCFQKLSNGIFKITLRFVILSVIK